MFSTYLKQLRREKGVTQTELAQAIGVSGGNVGDWERGRAKPGFDAIISLSRFFEISTDDLLLHDCESTQKNITTKKELSDSEYQLSLTKDEYDLLQMYRALDIENQIDAFGNMKMKYDRTHEKGKLSRSTYTKETADELLPDETAKGTA